VHGSGPNDRDETMPGGSKPFKDIAWGLASRGIGVLRYDKRTLVHGARIEARGFTVEGETIADALEALAVARAHPSADAARVFLLGHSLGATFAPEIAARDAKVAGTILLAGTARPLSRVIIEQLEYLSTLGRPRDQAMLTQLAAIATRGVAPDSLVMGIPASYFYDIEARDPIARVRSLTSPVLVLQGGRDYQVTMEDFSLWEQALRGKSSATLKAYPDLNHLFVTGTGKATPAEYTSGRGHVAELVIDDLASWITRAGGAPRN
jgi:uncharacterized protein